MSALPSWPVLAAGALGCSLAGPALAMLAARLARRPLEPALAAAAMAAALAVAASAWAWRGGVTATAIGLGWTLATLAMVDVLALRLPDGLTLPLAAAGLAQGWLAHDDPAGRLAGALAGYGVLAALALGYRRLRAREGLGLGDAKLYAAGGAWLGWAALPAVMLVAAALGLAWAAVALVRRGRAALAAPLPFGAPLAAAVWAVWLLQG